MQPKDRSSVQEACVYDPTQSFKTQNPSNRIPKVSEYLGRTSSDVQPCLRMFQVWKWAVGSSMPVLKQAHSGSRD